MWLFYIIQTYKFWIFMIFLSFLYMVTATFDIVAVFYRCIIIENACKEIFKGNKYIAHLLN